MASTAALDLIIRLRDEASSSLAAIGGGLDDVGDTVTTVSGRLDDLEASFKGAIPAGVASAITDVRNALEDLESSEDDSGIAANNLRGALGQLDTSLAGIDEEAAAAGKGLADLGEKAKGAGIGFASFQEIATGALRHVGTLAVEAFANMGQAAVGFVGDSISVAGEFEAGMNRLASVTGDSLSQAGLSLDDFSQKFLELGAETQFSAAQAQDAAIALAKGGIPVADILGNATAATLGLAAAGELELGPAADIVAKQLGVWADTGIDAATVANQLAQAANASTVDVDELALGLANVGGTAKTAGVDFEDLTQTMALIAPNFSSAADAGTSLATMIRGFQPTTGPAREAMRDIGLLSFNTQEALAFLAEEGIKPASNDFQDIARSLSQYALANEYSVAETNKLVDSFNTSVFYDAQGAFVGMEEASRLLAGATGDLSEAEKVMAFSTIFGSDAIRAAAAVAEAGAPGFVAMGESMTNAGSAADQAAIKQQGFAFALDSLKGTIETVQIVIGGALLPVLTDLLNNAIIPATNAFLTFAQSVLSSTNPIGDLVNYVNSLLPSFLQLEPILAGLATGALATIGYIITTSLIPAFIAWATAAGTAAIATITALAPVLIPIAAISAAVGLLYAAWQNDFGGIATFLTGWWEGTGRPIFEQLQQWLSVQLTAAIQALSAYWTNTLWPALQTVGGWITGTLFPILQTLATTVFTQVIQGVQLLTSIWVGTLWPALQSVGGWIQTNLVPIFTTLVNIGIKVVEIAVIALALVWETTLRPALEAVGNFISTTLGPIFSTMAKGTLADFKAAGSGIATLWTTTLQPAMRVFGDYLGGGLKLALDVVTAMVKDFQGALNNIGKAVDWVYDKFKKLKDLWDSMKQPEATEENSPSAFEMALRHIGAAATDTQANFKSLQNTLSAFVIPSALEGNSPPPLADWFAYIAEATRAADAAMAQFGGTAESLASNIKNFSKALVDDAFKGVIGLARGQISAIDAIRGLGEDTGGVEAAQDEARGIMEDRQRLGEQIVAQEQKLAELVAADPNDPKLRAERERLALLYEQNDVMARQHRQALDAVRAAEQQQQFMQEIARSAQGALEAALSEAEALQATDPASAAAFFDLRQRQIVELAELQKRLATTESDAEFQALSRQRVLLEAAQQAERLRFDEDMRRRQEERQGQIDQINEGLGGLTWKDEQGKEHTLSETDPRWAALFQGLMPLTDVFSAAADGVTRLLDTISAAPAFSGTGPGTSGPLGPNPIAVNITINGTAPANIQAQIQQGVQQGLAAAGINADLRRRQQ